MWVFIYIYICVCAPHVTLWSCHTCECSCVWLSYCCRWHRYKTHSELKSWWQVCRQMLHQFHLPTAFGCHRDFIRRRCAKEENINPTGVSKPSVTGRRRSESQMAKSIYSVCLSIFSHHHVILQWCAWSPEDKTSGFLALLLNFDAFELLWTCHLP